jgi:hypothetical protein
VGGWRMARNVYSYTRVCVCVRVSLCLSDGVLQHLCFVPYVHLHERERERERSIRNDIRDESRYPCHVCARALRRRKEAKAR